MADLKSFAQPTNTTLYTDVVDTEKGFHGAHAKLVHSDYASPPVGAVNLDNPGGATRTLKQWNGVTYTGFDLLVDKLIVNGSVDLNSTGAKITSNGTDTVLFGDSSGGYLQYVKGSSTWNLAIGGVPKLAVDSAANYTFNSTTRHIFNGFVQSEIKNTAAPTDQKNWKTNTGPNSKQSFISNDSDTIPKVYDMTTRVGNTITTRALNQDGGRLLVGQSVTDDGATALQTTSYSASNQPGLIGSGVLQNITTPTTLQIALPALKGGVTLQGGSTAITAPVAGTYMLLASVFCIAPIVAAQPYLEIVKNGVLLVRQGAIQMSGNNTPYSLPVILAIAMLPGDYVSVRIGTPNNVPIDARFDSVSFTKLN